MGKGAGISSNILRKMIETFKINNLDSVSNMIGFMTKFKKLIMFKTKKLSRSESRRVLKGQACPSAGETRYVTLSRINNLAQEISPKKTKYRMDARKKDITSIYEYSDVDIKQIIDSRKKPNRQNTALISPVQLCVETELLLRYLDDTTDKKWFFSTIEDAINNISEIKK